MNNDSAPKIKKEEIGIEEVSQKFDQLSVDEDLKAFKKYLENNAIKGIRPFDERYARSFSASPEIIKKLKMLRPEMEHQIISNDYDQKFNRFKRPTNSLNSPEAKWTHHPYRWFESTAASYRQVFHPNYYLSMPFFSPNKKFVGFYQKLLSTKTVTLHIADLSGNDIREQTPKKNIDDTIYISAISNTGDLFAVLHHFDGIIEVFSFPECTLLKTFALPEIVKEIISIHHYFSFHYNFSFNNDDTKLGLFYKYTTLPFSEKSLTQLIAKDTKHEIQNYHGSQFQEKRKEFVVYNLK